VEEMNHDIHDISEAWGAHNGDLERIMVYVNDRKRNHIEHTFLHELIHAILEAAQLNELNKNEDCVDQLAALLHQFLQTAEGSLI
jgi:uncharacterized protein (UPF0305 family)